jgi:hypothetical protein
MPVNPATVTSVVSSGGYWSRLAIARELGKKKTSHVCNQIDMAWRLGYINRVWSNDGIRDCWMYTVEPELI